MEHREDRPGEIPEGYFITETALNDATVQLIDREGGLAGHDMVAMRFQVSLAVADGKSQIAPVTKNLTFLLTDLQLLTLAGRLTAAAVARRERQEGSHNV